MARTTNKPTEQIQTTAPHSPAPSETGITQLSETQSGVRVPFVWKLVFTVWGVCAALMILYEVTVLIGKVFLGVQK